MSASLSDQEIEDKYFLLGQMEILNILTDLIHRREPVTVYFNGGQDFILTILLAANSDGLVFDIGGEPRTNKLLSHANRCVFMAFPDGVRVQFSGVDPELFMWGDEDAFWVPLPDRVVRMQRRDNYRNVLPLINGLRANLSDEDGNAIADWPLHNLSVSGFGAVVDGEPHVRTNDTIAHVVIWLSDKKRLDCVGIIRHITLIDRHGKGRYRVGVQLIDVPHVLEVAIQRYIIKIEYERHKLLAK